MRRFSVLAGLSLALLASLGCRKDDSAGGSTSGTSLYLYDQATQQIQVWNDLDTVYAATTPPAADKTLTASVIKSNIATLAWGGMTLDPNRNQLFLVSSTGTVVRISNLRSQTGAITTTTDLASFPLDTSNRLAGSVFGQASVDPQTGTLYVTESGTSSTRIWVVANAGSNPDGSPISPGTFLQVASGDDSAGSGDTLGAAGVSAAQGQVFAYMDGGAQIGAPPTGPYSGPRLRKSSDGSTFSSVIIGTNTELGAFGSVAFDTADTTVYVSVNTTLATTGTHPVVAFKTGDFTGGFNQAPDFTLDTPAVTNLRVLAHAGNKDWLVGLKGTPGTGGGSDTAYGDAVVWKAPSGGSASGAVITLNGSAQFRGAALDGSGG